MNNVFSRDMVINHNQKILNDLYMKRNGLIKEEEYDIDEENAIIYEIIKEALIDEEKKTNRTAHTAALKEEYENSIRKTANILGKR